MSRKVGRNVTRSANDVRPFVCEIFGGEDGQTITVDSIFETYASATFPLSGQAIDPSFAKLCRLEIGLAGLEDETADGDVSISCDAVVTDTETGKTKNLEPGGNYAFELPMGNSVPDVEIFVAPGSVVVICGMFCSKVDLKTLEVFANIQLPEDTFGVPRPATAGEEGTADFFGNLIPPGANVIEYPGGKIVCQPAKTDELGINVVVDPEDPESWPSNPVEPHELQLLVDSNGNLCGAVTMSGLIKAPVSRTLCLADGKGVFHDDGKGKKVITRTTFGPCIELRTPPANLPSVTSVNADVAAGLPDFAVGGDRFGETVVKDYSTGPCPERLMFNSYHSANFDIASDGSVPAGNVVAGIEITIDGGANWQKLEIGGIDRYRLNQDVDGSDLLRTGEYGYVDFGCVEIPANTIAKLQARMFVESYSLQGGLLDFNEFNVFLFPLEAGCWPVTDESKLFE